MPDHLGQWHGPIYVVGQTLIMGTISCSKDGEYAAYGCTYERYYELIDRGLTRATAKRRVEEWVRGRLRDLEVPAPRVAVGGDHE